MHLPNRNTILGILRSSSPLSNLSTDKDSKDARNKIRRSIWLRYFSSHYAAAIYFWPTFLSSALPTYLILWGTGNWTHNPTRVRQTLYRWPMFSTQNSVVLVKGHILRQDLRHTTVNAKLTDSKLSARFPHQIRYCSSTWGCGWEVQTGRAKWVECGQGLGFLWPPQEAQCLLKDKD